MKLETINSYRNTVLKKGDPSQKENYSPVSCLPAASKLLEKVICEQVSEYLETNKE